MSKWSPRQRLDVHPSGEAIKIQAATRWLSHEVMSPTSLVPGVSAVKSRRTRSGVAAGSSPGMVVCSAGSVSGSCSSRSP